MIASPQSLATTPSNASNDLSDGPLLPAPSYPEADPTRSRSVAEANTPSPGISSATILAAFKVLAAKWVALYLEEACCGVNEFHEPAAATLSDSSSSENEDRMKPRGWRAPNRFVRLSDNSFEQDNSRNALDAKLRSILQQDLVEDYSALFKRNGDAVQEMGPIILDDNPEYPHILTYEQMSSLAEKALPPTLKCSRWTRLYSLARDGDSFDTFLMLAGGAWRSLLVVRNGCGEVFGAYADSPWRDPWNGPGGNKFQGTARSCLWRVSPSVSDSNVEVYNWTGANCYIQLLDMQNRMIAFGGGGAKANFGLSLGDDFSVGSTGPCATFDNEPLCQQGEHFEIVDVECWGFFSRFS